MELSVSLTIAPLVAAIGAGNCAVLKPSAYSPNVSRLMREMTEELFVPGYVCCIEGGRQENESLLNERFDYIYRKHGSWKVCDEESSRASDSG